MAQHTDVPSEIVARVRLVCGGFPEVVEEAAWVGTRWRVRKRTFAHVLMLDDGWPPVYARASGISGPMALLMFRSSEPELDVLRNAGPPFFGPPWRADEVGLMIGRDADGDTDWADVAELLTESYCAQAPKRLARLVVRPEGGGDPPGDDTAGDDAVTA